MKVINLVCINCSISFTKEIKEYNRKIKQGKLNFYCSKACYGNSNVINIKGEIFSNLTVLERVGSFKLRQPRWKCICTCGKITYARRYDLLSGAIKSCGCKRKFNGLKHGHARANKESSTYQTWKCMIQRCTNPNYRKWKTYGGRGITICNYWRVFANFLLDVGEKPEKGWHLHRIDSSKAYGKENCIWISPSEHSKLHWKQRKLKAGIQLELPFR